MSGVGAGATRRWMLGVGAAGIAGGILAACGGEAAPAAPAAPAASPLAHLRGTKQKANRIRQITAKKTRESLQSTAQLTQTHEVDMTRIVALRARARSAPVSVFS